ncbi:hypothetical protein [Roseovarius nanhaiticus]|uniref:hypothetical protein n=1 Tax=Roseovarius nanhaiticus TaxID=573024 RepID=UPI00248FDAF5|nr:hypothetical protein [Roseovarius nanhaiticus]
MTPSPTTPAPESPLTSAQYQTLSDMLQKLTGLILPLHKLLDAQGSVEDQMGERLEQVIEALAAISASLRTSATMLCNIQTSQADFPSLERSLAQLQSHRIGLDKRQDRMDAKLDILIDWLGAQPVQRVAAPNS